MPITSGFKKTKKYRKLSDGNYQLQSEWTSASTVEMDNGNTVETEMTTHDTQNNTTTFTNEDCETSDANEWTDISPLTSGETHKSIFSKLGTMFRNIRYLFKELGTTDISSIGDGTVKGAVSTLNSNLAEKISTTSDSKDTFSFGTEVFNNVVIGTTTYNNLIFTHIKINVSTGRYFMIGAVMSGATLSGRFLIYNSWYNKWNFLN